MKYLHKKYGHTRIECIYDVDWARSKEEKISTSGYCVFVRGNLISWKSKSKKQSIVSRSSAE